MQLIILFSSSARRWYASAQQNQLNNLFQELLVSGSCSIFSLHSEMTDVLKNDTGLVKSTQVYPPASAPGIIKVGIWEALATTEVQLSA